MKTLKIYGNRRLTYFGSGAGIVSMAYLMIVAPPGLVTAIFHPPTLPAPYNGSSAITGKSLYTQCGSASSVKPAKWNPLTGGLTASEKAKSHGCGNLYPPGSPASANAEGYANVAIPTGPLSGNNVNISLNFTFTETSTGGVIGTQSCLLGNVTLAATLEVYG